jgi:tetratricopeptide (TPR) repeat protein
MTMLDTKKLNKLWAKSTDLQNPLRERHMFDLAFFLWSNRQFEESIAVSATLLELMADRLGASLWIDAMHLQSMALHDAKRDDEAIKAELLALEYGETLEPASERAFMHWHLADCYRTAEQPELQESEYLKAIDAFIASENKFFLGQAYLDLGNLHYGARRYDQSKRYFHLAVPVLEETSRTDRMPFVKYRLAGIERHNGNLQAALKYAEEACTLAAFAKDIVAERENMIEVGLVHAGLGNYETAISYFDALIDNNSDAAENRSAAKAVYCRAQVLEQSGNLPEAKKNYEKAIPLLKVVNLEEMAINAHLALIHIKTSS